MAYDIGPKIGITGEAEFRQAINALNTSFKTLGTEMAAVTSAFDKNDKSSKALTAQNGVLNKQIDTQKDKLVQLNSGLAQSTEKYGAADKVTQGWQQAVNKATAELNKMDAELAKNNKSIDLQNSNWTKMGKSLDDIGSKMKTVGAGLSSVGKSMAMGITAPIVGLGVAAVKLASDLAENMNKVDVAFKGNAGEVKDWSKTTLKSFGISQGSALEMSSLFGDMGTAMGQSTSEASKMSTGLVGLAGDLSSFKNIGIDQAQDALKGIFTGEGESLKSLGIIMQDSTLKAFALATGQKKTYEEMTQAEKVALRYAFVMDATKNSQGDFARTSDGTANQMRIFGETMKELGANIGQYLLPVVTPLIAKLSEMAKSFGALSPATQKMILVIAGIAAVVGPVLIVIGAIVTAVGAIAGAFGAASLAIATAGGAMAVAMAIITSPITIAIAAIALLVTAGVLLYKNWDTIKAKAVEVWANITGVISGAWTAITTAVTLAVEGVKTVVTTVWTAIVATVTAVVEGFKATVLGIFSLMAEGLGTIMTGLQEVFGGIWDLIIQIFGGAVILIIDLLTGNFEKLQTDMAGLWNNIKGDFQTIWEGIKLVFAGALSAITSLLTAGWNSISAFATTAWNNMKTNAINTFNSLKDGINTAMDGVKSSITNGLDSASAYIRNLPSQARNWGADIIRALADGIRSVHIPRPDFDFTISYRDIGSGVSFPVPHVDVNWYDQGGVFTRPSVIGIGEKRPEFVGALDDLKYIVRSEIERSGKGPAASGGVTVTGNNFYVRNDQDIKLIARELYNLQQQTSRGRGLA